MTDAQARTTFQTGRVVSHAVQLLKRDPYALPLYALIFAGLPNAAMTYLNRYAFEDGANFSHPERWAILIVGMLAAALAGTILQAVVARAALGESPLITPGGDVPALLALGLITSLGIMAGLVLLAIPGVILSLAWMVVVPVMVTERVGVMEAIRRSNSLTGEARGAIFGLAVAFGLAQWLTGWLTGLAASAAHDPTISLLADALVQSLMALVSAAGVTAIYHELRRNKDGAWTETLADVFD